MVDGKMVSILLGDSGAFCHYCDIKRKEANDLVIILQQFRIVKGFTEILETWRKLESGEIGYNNSERKGQVNEPISSSDVKFFAILHQKLRSLDHCLKILYHIVSGNTHTWSEANPAVKASLKLAKMKVIQIVKRKTGMLLDSPTSQGGNTNSGPLADRFFGVKDREDISSTIENTEERENFSSLLSKINVFLTITQSVDNAKKVDPLKVKDLGHDLMVFHKTSFPWAMISPSFHQMAAHSWELFQITDGAPIAKYSEQSGESQNKYIRAYKSGCASKARQTSVKENTRDIFVRLMLKSHPKIACRKRLIICKRCGKVGHTVRSCQANHMIVRSEEEEIIRSCYV